MLFSLEIKNFAIIDQIFLKFSPKLNIITGETGAGKSILLGALGLLMGERAQANQMLNAEEKGFIEGLFHIERLGLHDFFVQNDLDYSPELLIRRELLPGGKSRAFVNDSPCSVQVLSELGGKLVDIHSQHDSLELKSSAFQMEIVDAFADVLDLKLDFKSQFTALGALRKELNSLKTLQEKGDKELELKKYQLDELQLYEFESWNWSSMESDLEWMENSLEIKELLITSSNSLSYNEVNLVDSLNEILQKVRKFEKKSTALLSINESLGKAIEDLKDVAKEYESLNEKIDFDEESINALRDKIQFGVSMMRKHQIKEFADLIACKSQLSLEMDSFQNLDKEIASLISKISKIETSCLQLAKHISEKRKKTKSIIESGLLGYLKELNMEESRFDIDIQTDENAMTEQGIDTVKFLFSANKGKAPQELKNAISGGEMSRFMLGLKSMMAQKIKLPTLIFDEIDTGVSGTVASKVANILDQLSSKHQVIAITHLPQIASRGDYHLQVYKETDATNTLSKIKLLQEKERELEIAKMISGDSITDISLAGARELLSR